MFITSSNIKIDKIEKDFKRICLENYPRGRFNSKTNPKYSNQAWYLIFNIHTLMECGSSVYSTSLCIMNVSHAMQGGSYFLNVTNEAKKKMCENCV